VNERIRKENKQIGRYDVETLKNGTKSYVKQLKVGVDTMTGKVQNRKIRARSFDELKVKIERAKREFEDNGRTVKVQSDVRTFHDLVERWKPVYQIGVKYNSWVAAMTVVDNYLIPAFGDYLLTKITRPLIQDVVDQWAIRAYSSLQDKGRKQKYNDSGCRKDVKDIFSRLKSILEYGLTKGYLQENPADRVVVPKLRDDGKDLEVKCYTKAELAQFLDLIDSQPPRVGFPDYRRQMYRAYFPLLAYSGMRSSEALALSWDDIDFEKRISHVSKTLNRKALREPSPKTKGSIRSLYMDPATMQKLKYWKAYQGKDRLKAGLPKAKSPFQKRLGEEHEFYGPVPIVDFVKRFCERENPPYFGLHGFRHTHASLMIAAGVGYKEIQSRLGHSDIKMTMNTYGHLYKEAEKSAIDTLQAFMAR